MFKCAKDIVKEYIFLSLCYISFQPFFLSNIDDYHFFKNLLINGALNLAGLLFSRNDFSILVLCG